MPMRRCKEANRREQPCQSPPTKASGYRYCFHHTPGNETKVREAQVRGGKKGKPNQRMVLRNPREFRSDLLNLAGVSELLATVIQEVRSGELETDTARCLGYLAGHLIKALEKSNLERRVEDLEALMTR